MLRTSVARTGTVDRYMTIQLQLLEAKVNEDHACFPTESTYANLFFQSVCTLFWEIAIY